MEEDPLSTLPFEIFTTILSYLSPYDLGKCALMSSLWNDAANSSYVWDLMCDQLWRDKVYVPEEFRIAKENGFSKRAYILSIRDSTRQHVTADELCEFVWNFRFKEAAGDHWLANDPWWNDRKPARVKFSADGLTSLDDWPVPLDDSGQVLERRWKFIKSAAGMQGPTGSFLQINNFPPLVVSRFKNWGFLLQSCWVFYTSFPMPRHGACIELEDKALEITTETMKQEAMRYNIGVEFNLHDFNVNDHAQILDLLQLLAHIHQPNDGADIAFPGGDDDTEGDSESEGDESESDGDEEMEDDGNVEDGDLDMDERRN